MTDTTGSTDPTTDPSGIDLTALDDDTLNNLATRVNTERGRRATLATGPAQIEDAITKYADAGGDPDDLATHASQYAQTIADAIAAGEPVGQVVARMKGSHA